MTLPQLRFAQSGQILENKNLEKQELYICGRSKPFYILYVIEIVWRMDSSWTYASTNILIEVFFVESIPFCIVFFIVFELMQFMKWWKSCSLREWSCFLDERKAKTLAKVNQFRLLQNMLKNVDSATVVLWFMANQCDR